MTIVPCVEVRTGDEATALGLVTRYVRSSQPDAIVDMHVFHRTPRTILCDLILYDLSEMPLSGASTEGA